MVELNSELISYRAQIWIKIKHQMFTTQTCSLFLQTPLDLSLLYSRELDNRVCFMKYRGQTRGVSPRPQSIPKSTKPYFFNTLTAIIKSSSEASYWINAKISANGTIQLTGCKREDDAVGSFELIWSLLGTPDTETTIIWYMTNLNINTGVGRRKEELAAILRTADFPVLLIHEPFYCYSGLLFKIPLDYSELAAQPILRISCKNGQITHTKDVYQSYLDTLDTKKRAHKSQRHYISFLCFASGKMNVSGIGAEITMAKVALVTNLFQSVK